MKQRRPQVAILVLSHIASRHVEGHFRRIKTECGADDRVVFLCDNTSGAFDRKKDDDGYFLFSLEQLAGLNYRGKAPTYTERARQDNPHHKEFNFRPGSIELPVLFYYRQHPEHDYYWVVEYDVRYSGSWRQFFSFFANWDADLLGTTINRYDEVPDWFHWRALDLADMPISREDYIRGFFPIYRISRRALAQLDHDYQTGVSGHFECLGPTLLHHAGMKIEDIGGDGAFVRRECVNRFYDNTPTSDTLSPGTFVFRPAMHRPGKEPDRLWHPVKPVPGWRAMLRGAKRTLSRTRHKARPVS